MTTQAQIIAWLARPAAFGKVRGPVQHRETHGAHVFLCGDAAIKIKKTVSLAYFDFTSLAARRHFLTRELELNRRTAPDLYRDVVAIREKADGRFAFGGRGRIVEWALRMRRFDENDLLANRVDRAGMDDGLAVALADAIADYHFDAPIDRRRDPVAVVTAIVDEIATFLAGHDPALRRAFEAPARRALHGVARILRRRRRQGFCRRGHGDLHLANIVLIDGRPVLFDALEFNEDFATNDVVYDLAFVLADLILRGEVRASQRLLDRYLWRRQIDSDCEALAALPLFLSLRAAIRGMVGIERARQEGSRKAAIDRRRARAMLKRAIGFLTSPPPVLVAIGGLSGSGKTTIAAALAPGFGAPPGAIHLRSDLERKALAGVGETERLPAAAYTSRAGRAVYAALRRKAALLMKAGRSVIVDAVHLKPAERAAIAAIGRRHGRFVGIWLDAGTESLKARVAARRDDASDATPAVVARQAEAATGRISWLRVPAQGRVAATTRRAAAAIAAALGADRPRRPRPARRRRPPADRAR